jgi:hypothetical protein
MCGCQLRWTSFHVVLEAFMERSVVLTDLSVAHIPFLTNTGTGVSRSMQLVCFQNLSRSEEQGKLPYSLHTQRASYEGIY